MFLALRGKGSLRAALFVFLWLVFGARSEPQPEAATGYTERPAAAGERFAVVTANPHATEAAVVVLKAGGSAIDAAIAAQLVLNLVEPQSSGIGGGGFLLHWDAKARALSAVDGRETAPGAADPGRFAAAEFSEVVATGRSIGTPGLVAMLALAHGAHGKLPWDRLFEPAIRLAERGFPVSPRLHALLRDDPYLRRDASARALYYDGSGVPIAVGGMLRNPALAVSLRTLALAGPTAFYRGPLGIELVAAVRAAGSDIAMADLAAYTARWRVPVCGSYRQWRICGMPPPSSGGVAVLQLLGILERTPFAQAAPMSAEAVHWFAEAGRLAYADRARYLGDPDFVAVPMAALLAPGYLDVRRQLLQVGKSLGKAPAGEPVILPLGEDSALEKPATTHLSIVDAEGNAVAMTASIEDAFGSRKMAGGFLLNNQLTDFSFRPDADGRPVANRVEPGKRPLSSMAPTMVFDGDGRLLAVLGSPGGSRIINYVAQALVALLDWELPPADAVGLPHFGSRNGPTELERGAFAETMKPRLEAMGHGVVAGDMTSGLHVIMRRNGHWVGAADPRREGRAAAE